MKHLNFSALMLLALLIAFHAVPACAQVETTVYSLDPQGTGTDGYAPEASLLQGSGGEFFGTTVYGGTFGGGTFFGFNPSSAAAVDLATAYDFPAGSAPNGLIETSNGKLFGTTSGNSTGGASVYEITKGGVETTIASLPDSADNIYGINGPLVEVDPGTFYATSSGGGIDKFKYGTTFSVTTRGAIKIFASFEAGPNHPSRPASCLTKDVVSTSPTFGRYYGTTLYGGPQNEGSAYLGLVGEPIHFFVGNLTDGRGPASSLVQDVVPASPTYGDFYGTTQWGGLNGFGTLYLVTPVADGNPTVTMVYSFGSGGDARTPYANLTQDLNPESATYGQFYGISEYGGDINTGAGFGAVYLIKPSGPSSVTESVLYSFAGGSTDGANPRCAMTQDLHNGSPSYGDFYGTTPQGGAHNAGTIYRFTP